MWLTNTSTSAGRFDPASTVVLGCDLAAGFGNFSLAATSQQFSFGAQLAKQIGARFDQPLIEPPGIGAAIGFERGPVIVPSPLQSTVLIDWTTKTQWSNLSVPGLTLAEAISLRPKAPLVDRQSCKQTSVNLILGFLPFRDCLEGKTVFHSQLELAKSLKPTFAIVELGFTEVITAALIPGAVLPDRIAFEKNLRRLVGDLATSSATVVLTTIPDPADMACLSSLNEVEEIAMLDPGIIGEFWTSAVTLPGARTRKIAPSDRLTTIGLNEIGYQVYARTAGATAPGGTPWNPLAKGSLVSGDRIRQVSERVTELNRSLTALADKFNSQGKGSGRSVLVVDLASLIRDWRVNGLKAGSRVLTAGFLGGIYSLNGYSPGATGHAAIANTIIRKLNSQLGMGYVEIDLARVMNDDPVASFKRASGPRWTREQLQAGSTIPAPPAGALPYSLTRNPAVVQTVQVSTSLGAYALRLPASMEQTLPLNPDCSYFGDAITAQDCSTPREIQWGSGNNLYFGGLAMTDSHLRGEVSLRFEPPAGDWSDFEISFGPGLHGEASELAAPSYFRMPATSQSVEDVPGKASGGRVNLRTGEVDSAAGSPRPLTLYAGLFNSALFALLRVNPRFPTAPLSFPGPYGSAYGKFEQRPDGRLDFTFAGSTFVPLGADTSFPLNFGGPSRDFASIPARGTVLHPHICFSTRSSATPPVSPASPGTATKKLEAPEIPYNSLVDLTLFSPVSSFGDLFRLRAPQLGGPALGRSRLMGRIQLQIGPKCGSLAPVAVSTNSAGGLFLPINPTPIADEFPGRLSPGPGGFGTELVFPLSVYQFNDLFITDDPFDLAVGAIDIRTGAALSPILHRGFIHQDMIFALLRLEKEIPHASFYFRGDAALTSTNFRKPVWNFFGQVHLPFRAGLHFPAPNLATSFVVDGDSLDPYLWLNAVDDGERRDVVIRGAEKRESTRGHHIFYDLLICGAGRQRSRFLYRNSRQNGEFRMTHLTWLGIGKVELQRNISTQVTFSCFGKWVQNGYESNVQAAVQYWQGPGKPWFGIQISRTDVDDVNTPLPADFYPVPIQK